MSEDKKIKQNTEIKERLKQRIAELRKLEYSCGWSPQQIDIREKCRFATRELEVILAILPSVAQQPQPMRCVKLEDGGAMGSHTMVPESTPVQEEKCKACGGTYMMPYYLVTGIGICRDKCHASGIPEVSQPSAEPCNHEVGRTITCRLGTLGCSIHEPLPPDTNRASVEQKVAEPTALTFSRWLTMEGWTDGCYENRRAATWWLAKGEAYAAKQTASMRSQLDAKEETAKALAECTMQLADKLRVAESALRSRESVAIDYKQWLEDYAESKGEKREHVTDSDVQTLRDFAHDQKLRGQSVEKGLIAAGTKISNSYRDGGLIANEPDKEPFYDSLFTELNEALSSYRQATQPDINNTNKPDTNNGNPTS